MASSVSSSAQRFRVSSDEDNPPKPSIQHVKRVQIQAEARTHWVKILEGFRKDQTSLDAIKDEDQNASRYKLPRKDNIADKPFRFLDMPADIRNTICKLYVDTPQPNSPLRQVLKHPIWRRDLPHKHGRVIVLSLRPSDKKLYLAAVQGALSQVYTKAAKLMAKRGDPCAPIRHALEEYDVQWKYAGDRVYRENSPGSVSVTVGPRGNIRNKIPALSCTNRQMLENTWGFIFPDGVAYHAETNNFNLFPFFRFLQVLQRRKMKINGTVVSISLDYKEFGDARYKERFSRVKRLIQMHWFDSVPQWNCLTGLRQTGNIKSTSSSKDRAVRQFGQWMYPVRQMVKLWRARRATFREISIQISGPSQYNRRDC